MMKNMIVSWVLMYDRENCLAKKIDFSDGVNVITSSQVDGNKRGKSIILKSIYHTLGADCFFESKLKKEKIGFIIEFIVDDVKYNIYRFNRLFKLYKNDELILKTIHRSELAEKCKEIFEFGVMLPDRNSSILRIAPPAFNFLPYFIDSDKQDGTEYRSFDSLREFSDYKESLLLYHFGVHDENYYNLLAKRQEIVKNIGTENTDLLLKQNLIQIAENGMGNKAVDQSLELLKSELASFEKNYIDIIDQLTKTKKSLIELRNKRFDYLHNMQKLEKLSKDNSKELGIIYSCECPVCHNELKSQVEIDLKADHFIKENNLIALKLYYKGKIDEIDLAIVDFEKKYNSKLIELDNYKKMISKATNESEEILKLYGLQEVRGSLLLEAQNINIRVSGLQSTKKEIDKQLSQNKAKMKKAEDLYITNLLEDFGRFGIDELATDVIKGISSNFVAHGSNKAISTVLWYMNVLKVKAEVNPDAIMFSFSYR